MALHVPSPLASTDDECTIEPSSSQDAAPYLEAALYGPSVYSVLVVAPIVDTIRLHS